MAEFGEIRPWLMQHDQRLELSERARREIFQAGRRWPLSVARAIERVAPLSVTAAPDWRARRAVALGVGAMLGSAWAVAAGRRGR